MSLSESRDEQHFHVDMAGMLKADEFAVGGRFHQMLPDLFALVEDVVLEQYPVCRQGIFQTDCSGK